MAMLLDTNRSEQQRYWAVRRSLGLPEATAVTAAPIVRIEGAA
ncbi:hypothetical protein OHT93_19560 [Streptomyces sp. NBC_00191]